MAEFMALLSPTREEAILTQIGVETFQTTISETDDRILFADVALGLVLGRFGGAQPV